MSAFRTDSIVNKLNLILVKRVFDDVVFPGVIRHYLLIIMEMSKEKKLF